MLTIHGARLAGLRRRRRRYIGLDLISTIAGSYPFTWCLRQGRDD
jgi:hypothetical protein